MLFAGKARSVALQRLAITEATYLAGVSGTVA